MTTDNYPFPEKVLSAEHNEMFDAIKAKDMDRVFQAYTHHLFEGEDAMTKLAKWSL